MFFQLNSNTYAALARDRPSHCSSEVKKWSNLCLHKFYCSGVWRNNLFFLLNIRNSAFWGRSPQARNQGGAHGALENLLPPLEKCVGHRLKLLDIAQKIWAPPRKLFVPPGVPSWLRAWAPALLPTNMCIYSESINKERHLFRKTCTMLSKTRNQNFVSAPAFRNVATTLVAGVGHGSTLILLALFSTRRQTSRRHKANWIRVSRATKVAHAPFKAAETVARAWRGSDRTTPPVQLPVPLCWRTSPLTSTRALRRRQCSNATPCARVATSAGTGKCSTVCKCACVCARATTAKAWGYAVWTRLKPAGSFASTPVTSWDATKRCEGWRSRRSMRWTTWSRCASTRWSASRPPTSTRSVTGTWVGSWITAAPRTWPWFRSGPIPKCRCWHCSLGGT